VGQKPGGCLIDLSLLARGQVADAMRTFPNGNQFILHSGRAQPVRHELRLFIWNVSVRGSVYEHSWRILPTDVAQWTKLTNSLLLTNGAVRATNVDGTGFTKRFFIANEPD